jgi:hypothetical protein
VNIATVGAAILLISPLVAWPGFGYDTLRLPVVAAGAAVLLAGGALRGLRRESETGPGLAWTLALATFLGAHLLSWSAVTEVWTGLDPLIPVVAGAALFWSMARGWVGPQSHDLLLGLIGGVALLTAVVGFVQRPAVSTLGNTNYSGALAAILGSVCLAGALGDG